MSEHREIFENYKKHLLEEQNEELRKNSDLIDDFITLCKSRNIELTKDNFSYIQTIGIVAEFPNILYLLNNNFKIDKEELISFNTILSDSEQKDFITGYLFTENYTIMAHPYFRRGHYDNNNFAPRFIEKFWNFKKPNCIKYIALDFNRVRVNVDTFMHMELDTWYGASFKEDISKIENGVVKLRPPMDLEPFDIEFFFGNTYSLDIKWNSKNDIKVFQAEEFKEANSKIRKNGIEYFPVKYIHAEFDNSTKKFRHFDGAIHFYTESQYYQRRVSDFNYNNKSNNQLKTLSQKLFKINGEVEVLDWVELTSHYLTGNPLIQEYFEGKMSNDLIDKVNKLRNNRKQSS